MKKTALFTAALFALPFIAFAKNLNDLIVDAGQILNNLIPVLIAAAVVVFFWGLVRYILSPGEGHATGRTTMIAGLLALFVMVSVWGIIKLAQNTLGINGDNNNGSIVIPQVTQSPTNNYPTHP